MFLFGGIAISIIPFIKEASTTSTVFGVAICFVLATGSILTLIRDTVDGLKVEGNSITFRYNLRAGSIPLSPELEIKMRTGAMRVSGTETSGSGHIIITHYFQTADKEVTVLRFSMDKAQADDALKLGNTIKRTINNYIFEATRSI